MRLFIDFETSGLWRDEEPNRSASQPWPVQIGMRLYTRKWELMGSTTTLIKPEGRSIEPGAEATHHISEARCHRFGVRLATALLTLHDFLDSAEEVWAHHMEFERKIVEAALAKVGSTALWWLKRERAFNCTMERSKRFCRLPGKFGDFKFPTLAEAMAHFHPDTPYTEAHDAGADADACALVARAVLAAEGAA